MKQPKKKPNPATSDPESPEWAAAHGLRYGATYDLFSDVLADPSRGGGVFSGNAPQDFASTLAIFDTPELRASDDGLTLRFQCGSCGRGNSLAVSPAELACIAHLIDPSDASNIAWEPATTADGERGFAPDLSSFGNWCGTPPSACRGARPLVTVAMALEALEHLEPCVVPEPGDGELPAAADDADPPWAPPPPLEPTERAELARDYWALSSYFEALRDRSLKSYNERGPDYVEPERPALERYKLTPEDEEAIQCAVSPEMLARLRDHFEWLARTKVPVDDTGDGATQ